MSHAWPLVVTQLIKQFPTFKDLKLHYRVQKPPPLVPILSLTYPVHTLPTYLRCILILSSHQHPGLRSSLFPSGLPTELPYTFLISIMHATWSAHLFHHPNNIWWSAQVMKLLIMQSSPASRHSSLLCPNTEFKKILCQVQAGFMLATFVRCTRSAFRYEPHQLWSPSSAMSAETLEGLDNWRTLNLKAELIHYDTLLTHSLTHSHHGARKVNSYSACQTTVFFLYETRRFITVFTKPRHWNLSWASRIQFAPSSPIFLRAILMLSSHLRLTSGLPTKAP